MANWGQVRLDGDDDLSVGGYVRNLGMGIEGRPLSDQDSQNTSTGTGTSTGGGTTKNGRRASGMSMWSKFTVKENEEVHVIPIVNYDMTTGEERDPVKMGEARERQVLTTLALLQTFHAHTTYILSRLSAFLPNPTLNSATIPTGHGTVVLTPKDLLTFELGPLSGLDARFVEWLGDEYGERSGVRLVVRRGWRDLVGLVFGLG